MKISVTQKHIDDGLRGLCSSDPIALAMKEAGLEKPWVSPEYLTWRKNNKDFHVVIPRRVLQFVIDHDQERAVSPFEFELSE